MTMLKNQSLFVKLFLVTLISIILVSLLTLAITIRMSEQLFLQTFSITNTKLLNQMKSNLESYNGAVATTATLVSQSGIIRNYLTNGDTDSISLAIQTYNMTERMKNIRSNLSAYEVSIMVLGSNGRSYTNDPWYWSGTAQELKSHPITENTIKNPNKILYQLYHEQDQTNSWQEPVLVASKALYDRGSQEIYGTMYVMIRDSIFKSFYANFTSEGNDVLLMNDEGLVISSNRDELIGMTDKPLLNKVVLDQQSGEKGKYADLLGEERILFSEYLPEFDFYLVNLIDKDAAIGQMVNVQALTLTILAIVVIALIVVYWITRKMTRSMRGLIHQMSGITTKGFNNYVDVSTSSSEARELGNAFNFMLDELNDYVERLVETEKQQRNAELAALQMQINPHFLYNTLASVKFLVQQGDKERAGATINSLISLLQNTVSDVDSTIPVKQEIETLKDYVFINHVRYGERIRVNYFIEPDSMDYHVPKLIIQPFIENAFFHAFNHKGEGSILILISVLNEQLVCEVVDNGDGMNLESKPSHENELPRTKRNRKLFSGIGIKNVDERIKYMYGEGYGIHITSKLGEGTRVKITLPLIKADSEHFGK
ncbi:histidine kinase [Neobacillus mesonae]|nr:histidine kinase [Neobacillus mesonae]